MINGLGNLLSFADNNVLSNNNTYSLNNYSYDDSFAKMLNKTQSEELYSSSVSNKVVNNHTENSYQEYNDYNNYSPASAEEQYSENDNINTEKSSDNNNIKEKSENSEVKESKAENTEDSKKASSSEENEAVNKSNNNEEENKEVKENSSKKSKLAEAKEKAKAALQNANIANADKKVDKKENISRENLVSKADKADKKENIKNEEIENIKKEIESINAEELDEEDKKELADLIESLENLKNMIDAKDEEKDKKLTDDIKDDVKVKDIDKDSLNKEAKIALNKDDSKEEINNADVMIQNDNTQMAEASIDMNTENKYADRYNKDNAENNTVSSVNNTISDDKGAELTIINMKDSAEGANLKGYNHYNNVSKTHNSPNLSDSIIKFQDLMGKLVEKAQVALANGKSEVLMTLNPEHLGKVRLKINMDGDNLVGKIFVDNAEVKDIFTKNLDTVISSLNEIGINIEGFDVMLRQDMPNNGEFGEELNNNGTRLNFENNDNAEEVNADIKNYIVPERKLNLLI
ncbi:flagellar hook-length control protein FliK [Brachyspira alvinipulli]|uniref:flagellar hook-length control protein FliK n=1 Tax=Brachyspira alvinipulli TaxID=84379 RepID=UPI000487656B|nr:flagellar hook-length control protein FliK [Brachyspira alvinipulli]